MTRPLGIALVGCGRVTESWHLPALARVPGAVVAGLADIDEVRLRAMGERAGVRRLTPDYRELVTDPAVDIVGVCVPAGLHAEVVCAALAAGKHVLVEKPLALTIADCDAIAEAAGASGTKATVGFNQRELPHVRRALEARRAGALGDVKLLRSAFTSESRFRPGDPSWRWSRERGGGVLLEQAIHHLDLWSFLLDDEVEEVFALSAGEDESATVSGRTRAGTLLCGEFSDASAAVNELELYGTRARARISAYRFDGYDVVPRERAPGSVREHAARVARTARHLPAALRDMRSGGGFAATYVAEWRSLVAAVKEDLPVGCPVDDGARAVRVVLAALESSATGRPVAVDDAGREVRA